MRKLATIRFISDIKEHTNADSLELALIDGWQVVVRKGEFVSGDKVVYFEIDSWIPNHIAPFLSKGKEPRVYEGIKGERLRTIRLRSELSQGLILSLKDFSDYDFSDSEYEDGTDLTELLDIKKWEAPIPTELAGKVAGLFPSFIRKTDQERIQNFGRTLENMDYTGPWIVEEKMDGSSCTIYTRFHRDVAEGYYSVGVCSRNFELKLEGNETNAFILAATNEGWLEHLPKLSSDIAIQAELCGPGIQGNPYNLKEVGLFVFDIWSIASQRYATYTERQDILTELSQLGVKVKQVPHLEILECLPKTVNEFLTMADGSSIINPQVIREGIVFKTHGLYHDEIVSFKSISNNFLCKQKE